MQNEKLHTTTCPGSPPETELYRFGADGNLRMYSYDRLFYSLYGYDAGITRTYKYSFNINPQWVNGRLEAVNFNLHNAMFYPNAYINFNNNGYYTKHYYNGMERIASRLGDQALSISTHDPDLQDRKDWQDSLIRKQITEITGYEFLEPGEEQTLEDPKPVFELPLIGLNNLIPNTSSVYYYHSNHLGSTCYVTDENATVQQGFLYAPFGEITNEYNSGWQSGVLPKYSFNAKELDEETGMYYYEARYYAPPVFISRDPLFEKYPTFTPYAYCANNPVKYIDPTGMEFDSTMEKYARQIEGICDDKINKLSKKQSLTLDEESKLSEFKSAKEEIQKMREDKTTYYGMQIRSLKKIDARAITQYYGTGDITCTGKKQHWIMVSLNIEKRLFTEKGELNMMGLWVIVHELKHCYQFYNKETLYIQLADGSGIKDYNTKALEEAAYSRGAAFGCYYKFEQADYPDLFSRTMDDFINKFPGGTVIKHE